MKASDELFEFHKKYEGCSEDAYRDVGGVLTIGIGHANQETAEFDLDSHWDMDKIHEVWRLDLKSSEKMANAWIKGFDVSQVFFDALVDLAFNVGRKPKTMLKYLEEGDEDSAREELLRWIYVGKKAYLGLIRRRFAMYLYTMGEDWTQNIDSAIVKLGYELERDPSSDWKIMRL